MDGHMLCQQEAIAAALCGSSNHTVVICVDGMKVGTRRASSCYQQQQSGPLPAGQPRRNPYSLVHTTCPNLQVWLSAQRSSPATHEAFLPALHTGSGKPAQTDGLPRAAAYTKVRRMAAPGPLTRMPETGCSPQAMAMASSSGWRVRCDAMRCLEEAIRFTRENHTTVARACHAKMVVAANKS
jgi:hypothetical protein